MSLIELFRVEKNFFCEAFSFWLKLRRYNASSRTVKDMEKMQYILLRKTHTIEKGMSMRFPRKGFGQQKVIELLGDLIDYSLRYVEKDREFLFYPINTLATYINNTKSDGVHISEIETLFERLIQLTDIKPVLNKGGVITYSKSFILSEKDKNFESLLKNRHSVRYFTKETPSKEIVIDALNIAQMTPSACNRQGWKTHVFLGDDSVRLVKWQGGAHGFEDEIKASILVTANLKAFLFYEVHQAYIDGGLYSMNLINALHSLGMGTIPLSMGFLNSKLKSLMDFGIPENEVPIIIIGFGYMEDEFKAAVSERKRIELTNTFH